jgi:hypothetical protein
VVIVLHTLSTCLAFSTVEQGDLVRDLTCCFKKTFNRYYALHPQSMIVSLRIVRVIHNKRLSYQVASATCYVKRCIYIVCFGIVLFSIPSLLTTCSHYSTHHLFLSSRPSLLTFHFLYYFLYSFHIPRN